MKKKIVEYDNQVAALFKGIKWKDINTKFKDDYKKTEQYLRQQCGEEQWASVEEFVTNTLNQLKKLKLHKMLSTAKPPQGY